jgi:hypothetical protein
MSAWSFDLRAALLLTIITALSACQSGEGGSKLEQLNKEFEKTMQSAKEAIDGLKPHQRELEEKAASEAEKLFSFEYHVAEVAKDASPAEIEKILHELGKERWDCFHVEPRKNSLLFLCKRQPKTYLRYIPRLL